MWRRKKVTRLTSSLLFTYTAYYRHLSESDRQSVREEENKYSNKQHTAVAVLSDLGSETSNQVYKNKPKKWLTLKYMNE